MPGRAIAKLTGSCVPKGEIRDCLLLGKKLCNIQFGCVPTALKMCHVISNIDQGSKKGQSAPIETLILFTLNLLTTSIKTTNYDYYLANSRRHCSFNCKP